MRVPTPLAGGERVIGSGSYRPEAEVRSTDYYVRALPFATIQGLVEKKADIPNQKLDNGIMVSPRLGVIES